MTWVGKNRIKVKLHRIKYKQKILRKKKKQTNITHKDTIFEFRYWNYKIMQV